MFLMSSDIFNSHVNSELFIGFTHNNLSFLLYSAAATACTSIIERMEEFYKEESLWTI